MRSRSPPDQGQEHHNDLHGEADRSDPEEQRPADDLNLYHFGRKALLGLFVGYALCAGGIPKGDRLNAKKVLIP